MTQLAPPPGASLQRGCALLLSILLFLAGGGVTASLLLLILISAGSRTSPDALIPALIFTVLVFVVGLGLTLYNIRPWVAGFFVTRPDVAISNERIAVGDGVSVSFRQEFKRAASVKKIRLELVFREWAHYSAGKNSRTSTHEEVISEFDLPGREMEAGSELAFTQVMKIPREGMHTFESTHNRLTWFLRVTVDIAGWADYKEKFPIRVLPVLRERI